MARVFLPPPLRGVSGGVEFVEGDFPTVAAALAEVVRQHPALGSRLFQADQRLVAGWAIAVDGVAAPEGLRQPLNSSSEVHLLPALGGGC